MKIQNEEKPVSEKLATVGEIGIVIGIIAAIASFLFMVNVNPVTGTICSLASFVLIIGMVALMCFAHNASVRNGYQDKKMNVKNMLGV